jgi:prepilin-type processing-associated H-X9-DG protein
MRRFLVSAGLGFLVLVVLGCIGLAWPLDLTIAVVFGWIAFVIRVFPEIRVNWWGVATAVACLVPLAVGSHAFLTWFHGQADGAKEGIDRRWRWRWTGWLVSGIVLIFVAGLAAGGVAHQVGWLINSPEPLVEGGGGARSAARRAQSTNNLKQIGLALHNYHGEFGTFPPSAAFDRIGRPLHSWQAMILPYLERKDLFDRIHFAIPWDDPHNAEAYRTEFYVYQIPGITNTKDANGYALSHLAGNVHLLGGDARWTMKDVTDGEANTVMAGQVVSRFKPWGDPTNWRDPALGINRSPEGFGSPFAGGANFLFVDGSVHFIKDTIDPRVLEALGTPKGGERVSSEQY